MPIPPTIRGYQFNEVASALQKACRRADAKLAGYWAIELWESGYGNYVWKRLLTVSAEDCWGILTQEVEALHSAYDYVNVGVPAHKAKGRIFIAKAAILLCLAKKSRDADHLNNCVYDHRAVSDAQLNADLDEVRAHPEPIPDYALDVHTRQGKRDGKTKAMFFREEEAALNPKQESLFDDAMEQTFPP
jgi:replication-associated recombination protein RarA